MVSGIVLLRHKLNIQNNSTVQLLNLAKNEIGRMSKTILDNINLNLGSSLHFNQLENT